MARDKWERSRGNDKIGKTQTDQKRPVFGENSPGELSEAAQCVVKCTAEGLCQHLPQEVEAATRKKKPERRMKLGKNTHGFRSQELEGIRRESLKKLHLDEKKESKERENKEVMNKRET